MATKIVMDPTAQFWNGLGTNTAPVYSYVNEGVAMADNSITLTGPQIPIQAAKANLPGSYEIFEDLQGGSTARLQDLLTVGYRDLLGAGTITGSGVDPNPLGALTQMVATTTSPAHVTCTTLGTFTAVDARKAWGTLPGRFRDNATWLMNPTTLGVVRGWSTDGKGTSGGLSLSDYAETSTGPTLMGRPIRTSENMPTWVSTTGAQNIAMVGDWSQFYYITRLGGQTLDLVPNLFSTTTSLPTMQRALVSVIRHGYQLISPQVAVLVSNT
jgi:HK97 family phage major capsid protein